MPSLDRLGNSDGYVDLVRQLRALRLRKQMSQNDLDHAIGVTDGVVAKWESGARRPRSFLLCCWITALGGRMNVIEHEEASDSL